MKEEKPRSKRFKKLQLLFRFDDTNILTHRIREQNVTCYFLINLKYSSNIRNAKKIRGAGSNRDFSTRSHEYP